MEHDGTLGSNFLKVTETTSDGFQTWQKASVTPRKHGHSIRAHEAKMGVQSFGGNLKGDSGSQSVSQ